MKFAMILFVFALNIAGGVTQVLIPYLGSQPVNPTWAMIGSFWMIAGSLQIMWKTIEEYKRDREQA